MIIRRTTTRAELRAELEQFEAEYGVPSERMVEAFTVNGQLVETPAFARWSLLYTAEMHRQSKLVADSPYADEDQAFVSEVSEVSDD
jgi:hypothetical protein